MLTFVDPDQTSPMEHAFTVAEVVEAFGLALGLDDYPIFDEGYRAHLNRIITDHFWFRRIAAETPQMFVFYLNRKLREVMPTYNALYRELTREGFDPFLTNEGESHGTGSSTGEGSGTSTSNGTSKGEAVSITSTTPASYLTNPEGEQYMDGLSKTTNTGEQGATDSNSSTSKSASKTDSTYKGRSGSVAMQALEIQTARLMDVDAAVCDALEPLFIQFWDDQPY